MTSSLLFTKYEVEVCNFGTSVEWWPELLEGDWRELLLENLNQLQNVRLEVCLVVQTSGYDNEYIPLNLAKWFVYGIDKHFACYVSVIQVRCVCLMLQWNFFENLDFCNL